MLKILTQNRFARRLAKPTTHKMRGVVAVELALVLVFILVPLLFGVAELGRMLYQYNALTKSVRDGARLVSLCNPGFPAYASATEQATNLVVYGNIEGDGDPLVPGLESGDVDIGPPDPPPVGTVKMVTVKVSGFSLGYITGYFSYSLPFNDISITMRQSETCSTTFTYCSANKVV